MNKFLTVLLTSFALTACGSGDSSDEPVPVLPEPTPIDKCEEYQEDCDVYLNPIDVIVQPIDGEYGISPIEVIVEPIPSECTSYLVLLDKNNLQLKDACTGNNWVHPIEYGYSVKPYSPFPWDDATSAKLYGDTHIPRLAWIEATITVESNGRMRGISNNGKRQGCSFQAM